MEEQKNQDQSQGQEKKEESSVQETPQIVDKKEGDLEKEPVKTSEDPNISKSKPMAIVGYIIPILFFVPLLNEEKDDDFAKFHANQQLVLLLAIITIQIIGGIVPFLGWFIILPIGTIMILVWMIMGVVNASQGIKKELPIIGDIKILK